MTLNKITDKQGTSYLHITKSEILTIDWAVGKNLVFYAFDKSKNLRVIDKEYFGVSTVGNNYKKIEEQLSGSLEDYCSTKGENGDIYFCTHQEDKLYRFDKDGNKTLEWEVEIGLGHPIYDIKFESPDSMWFAFPTGQTVSQVSISGFPDEEIAISVRENDLRAYNLSFQDVANAEIDKKSAFGNFLPNINAQTSHSWNIGLNQNITTGLLEDVTTLCISLF
jgi:hypothetical protein